MADNETKTDSAEVETPVNHVSNMVDSLVDGDNISFFLVLKLYVINVNVFP